ncbi:HNH endonuclease [Salinarimonas soli]|uniref:HNH endonuclease n=1 Tax=Salinarimonas soli TaxID=1638099 RepID=A0A5B2VBY7_9HYPH|nr:HNH endonuclease [Salinarimonas soli]
MRFRKPLTILSRTSSVTNSFVQAILPAIEPTPDEIAEALAILGMTPKTITCAYCGTASTDWDHLCPLVKGKRPTGYITEIRNLVPSCGPCNQSKSGADWHVWMTGTAKGSPRTKGVTDLEARLGCLKRYVAWGQVRPLDLRVLGGAELWDRHWANLEALTAGMREAQLHAAQLRENIVGRLKGSAGLSSG